MSRRILVADDSSTIQKVIKIAFARHQIEIVEASSYIEALAAVVRQVPDLLVVDASLPGAQGPDDFSKLARDARGAPVLLLFGTYDNVDEAGFRQAGFPHFLKKPFESSDLLAMADRLLGGQLVREAPRREAPMMPPAPDELLPAGRMAHTTVIFEPGTFQLGDDAAQSARGRPAAQPPSVRGPSPMPELDLGDASPGGDDLPAPRVLTDESLRGRRAYVPEPPAGRSGQTVPPRGPAGARATVPPPPPPSLSLDAEAESPLEAELGRLGMPPPSPNLRARSPFDEPPQPPHRADRSSAGDDTDPRDTHHPVKTSRTTNPPAAPRGAHSPAIGDEDLLALLDERLPALARQAIEDYCERHFKSLAREIIAAELRRLADEKARHLVDN